MVSLRHVGRAPFLVSEKRSSVWLVTSPERAHLADLSGSALVQSLSNLPSPAAEPFSLVTPSSGVETPLRAELETEILKRARLSDGGCLWGSSGSDGIEIAIWTAETYLSEQTGGPIKTFLVRRGGYHGNTYLTRFLSTRGKVEHKLSLEGASLTILEECLATPEMNPLLEALREAEAEGLIVHPAVLVLEPRPTTGRNFWLGRKAYSEIVRWCRERKILVIFDEIASGAYRHGSFSAFAWDNEEVPDISVIAKGLTSGTFPLSCAILNPALTACVERRGSRPLSFTHGLSDPAAWFSLACLRRYDEIFASSAYTERQALIGDLAGSASRDLAAGTLEHSETTIRFSLALPEAQSAMTKLGEAGFWAYCGYSDFPAADRPNRRGFIHLCPPLDLANDQARRMLTEAVNAIMKTFDDVRSNQ